MQYYIIGIFSYITIIDLKIYIFLSHDDIIGITGLKLITTFTKVAVGLGLGKQRYIKNQPFNGNALRVLVETFTSSRHRFMPLS